MRRMWRIKALIITLVSMSTIVVESLRFELQSGTGKCMAQDIMNNAMTVGKYSVVNPNEGHPMPDAHKLTVRVTSPKGNNYHYSDLVDSGTFAFTTVEGGDYMACFWAAGHDPPMTLSIEFDWRSGVAAKDWSKVVKKGNIEVMELELKKLYDVVTFIRSEMFYLRERNEDMQKLNGQTNSLIATLSLFSILICLIVAGLQLWNLKSFFEKKKLL